MAVAGKVAITLSTENGGAWSADVTYDRLVAVKHNNNLYISRKTVANVEPPNDEFWFLALEGFGGEDVEALIDRLNELSDLIQAIIDGATQVGNAKTLDGHEAEYFAQKEELTNYLPKDSTATGASTLVPETEIEDLTGLTIPQFQSWLDAWTDRNVHRIACTGVRLGFTWAEMWNNENTTDTMGWGGGCTVIKIGLHASDDVAYLFHYYQTHRLYFAVKAGTTWGKIQALSNLDDLANYLPLSSIPMMLDNVEYRTPEYYLGEPVFTMVLNAGWTAEGAHEFDISSLSVNIPVSVELTNSNNSVITNVVSGLVMSKTTISVTFPDPLGSPRFILKYTKQGVTQ